MSYTKENFAKKAEGIIAIAKAQGISIKDLETAHVDSSGDTHRILGYLAAYMIWWAIIEKRTDICDRLAAELKAASAEFKAALARPSRAERREQQELLAKNFGVTLTRRTRKRKTAVAETK